MDELNNVLAEIKTEVSKQTGVPSALLTGNTYQEIADSADALIKYKEAYTAKYQQPKEAPSTAEQFGEWLNQNHVTSKFWWAESDQEAPVSTDSEPAYNGHPIVRDGGEAYIPSKPATTAELFGEWLNNALGCYW